MSGLRFALLLDGSSLERWQLDCIDELETAAELVALVVPPSRGAPTPGRGASRPLRWYARRAIREPRVDVSSRFGSILKFDPARLSGPDGLPQVDVVLRLGTVDVPPELATLTRHGVWCFEHEDRTNGIPFLQEVYDGTDVTRVALLTREPSTGATSVIEEGRLPTGKLSYPLNRARALGLVTPWPRRACERLLAGLDVTAEPSKPPAQLSSTSRPRRARLLPFLIALGLRRLDLARVRFFRHPQWNVGVLRWSVDDLLQGGEFQAAEVDWFPQRGRRYFLADPFGIVRDGVATILCERYSYRESKGLIAALTYTQAGFASRVVPAIAFPEHASYPQLVETAGETYCVPETSEANEVALLRATRFPEEWSKVAVLLPRFAGVDPTVFRHDGRWWLMATEKGRFEDVELRIWHAPDLLGPWTPHVRNPVKADVRGSRPAGPPFLHEGRLYRPAQDCSQTYGGRITVQRVMRLTPTEFAEETVTVIEASARDRWRVGPHTLTVLTEDLVLIDARRTVFVWSAFVAFLRIWARAVLARSKR
jgi:hypothetical protein